MLNAHLLSHSSCKFIEHRFHNLADNQYKDSFGIVFIYDEEMRDCRVRSYLDSYTVNESHITDTESLKSYVEKLLTVPQHRQNNTALIDEER